MESNSKNPKNAKRKRKPVKIIAVVSGGCLYSVYSSSINVEVELLDQDDLEDRYGRSGADEIFEKKTEKLKAVW